MTQDERSHNTAGDPFTNGIPAEALAGLEVPEQAENEAPAEKPAKAETNPVTFSEAPETTSTTNENPLSVHPEPQPTNTEPDDGDDWLKDILDAGDAMQQSIISINRAVTVTTDSRVVGKFVELARALDQLAIVKKIPPEEWERLTLSQVETRFKEWVKIDPDKLAKINAAWEQFKKTELGSMENLWRFYTFNTRSADAVFSHKAFEFLMLGNVINNIDTREANVIQGTKGSVCGRGLAICFARSFWKGETNPEKIEVGRFRFVPSNDPSSKLAWPYFKEAKTRADAEFNKRELEFNELQTQAHGLTPVDIDAGDSGTFFLVISQNRFQGLLMEAQTLTGVVGPSVRVIKSVGFPMGETSWMRAQDPFRLKESAKEAFQRWYKL